jgi:ATP-dependent Clp protease ATP-binding subunit ClpX
MYELPDKAEKEKGLFVVTPEIVRGEKRLFDTPPVPMTSASVKESKDAKEPRKKESA